MRWTRPRPAAPLYKTTVTIYSAFAPVSLEGLVNEALRADPRAQARVGANALITREDTQVVVVADELSDPDLSAAVLAYFAGAPEPSTPAAHDDGPGGTVHVSA